MTDRQQCGGGGGGRRPSSACTRTGGRAGWRACGGSVEHKGGMAVHASRAPALSRFVCVRACVRACVCACVRVCVCVASPTSPPHRPVGGEGGGACGDRSSRRFGGGGGPWVRKPRRAGRRPHCPPAFSPPLATHGAQKATGVDGGRHPTPTTGDTCPTALSTSPVRIDCRAALSPRCTPPPPGFARTTAEALKMMDTTRPVTLAGGVVRARTVSRHEQHGTAPSRPRQRRRHTHPRPPPPPPCPTALQLLRNRRGPPPEPPFQAAAACPRPPGRTAPPPPPGARCRHRHRAS